MNIKQEGVGVHGNQVKFAQYGHLATRLLELLRDGQHGPLQEDEQPETDEDHITGRYIYINAPVWGRTKVFYETSGNGPQQIVFLHTAGSDSRQYHGVMNDARMREKCTMIAFDLPAHGRSFPGSNRKSSLLPLQMQYCGTTSYTNDSRPQSQLITGSGSHPADSHVIWHRHPR